MQKPKGSNIELTGGYTYLMLKAEEGNLEEVRSILSSQSNLDINATNKHGYTALALATKGGFHNIVAALVLAGADVNQRNTSGQTPLFLACWHNHESIVNILLENGGLINATDHRGWTPLMISAFHGHREILKILLDHGADTEIKDLFGKKAVDRAKDQNTANLIQNLGDPSRYYSIPSPRKTGTPNYSPRKRRDNSSTGKQRSSSKPRPSTQRALEEISGKRFQSPHAVSMTHLHLTKLKLRQSSTKGTSPTRFLSEENFKSPIMPRSGSRAELSSMKSPSSGKSLHKTQLASPKRQSELTSPQKKRKQFRDEMHNLLSEHMNKVAEQFQQILMHRVSLEIPIQMQLYEEMLKRTMEEVLRSRVEDIFKNMQDFFVLKMKFLLNKLGYDTNKIEITSPVEAERFAPNLSFSVTKFTKIDPKAEKEIQKELESMHKSLDSLKIQRFNREQDPYEFEVSSLGFKAQTMKNELIDLMNYDIKTTTEKLFDFSAHKIGEVIKGESNTLHERLMIDLERNVQYLEDGIKNKFEDFITRKMNELYERLVDQPKKTQFSPAKRASPENIRSHVTPPSRSVPAVRISQDSEKLTQLTHQTSDKKLGFLNDSAKSSSRNLAREKIQQIKNSLNFLGEEHSESTVEVNPQRNELSELERSRPLRANDLLTTPGGHEEEPQPSAPRPFLQESEPLYYISKEFQNIKSAEKDLATKVEELKALQNKLLKQDQQASLRPSVKNTPPNPSPFISPESNSKKQGLNKSAIPSHRLRESVQQ